MTESVLIKLHGFVLELMTEPAESWDFWRWKIDSFRVPAGKAAEPDLRISLFRDTEIRIPMVEKLKQIDQEKIGFYTYTLYRYEEGWFWLIERPAKKQRILSFWISSAWDEIRLIEDNSGTDGQLAFEILNRILPAVLIRRSVIQIHAALLEDDGRGILICADSGVGKTTHARLWRDNRRSIIIDGDRATCVKDENGWTAFGIPWCGTSGEYMNRSVLIKAIVILDRGQSNEARRLEGIEPFLRVMQHLQYPKWDREQANKTMELVQDLTEEIPVIHLYCRPDKEAVEVLAKCLQEL